MKEVSKRRSASQQTPAFSTDGQFSLLQLFQLMTFLSLLFASGMYAARTELGPATVVCMTAGLISVFAIVGTIRGSVEKGLDHGAYVSGVVVLLIALGVPLLALLSASVLFLLSGPWGWALVASCGIGAAWGATRNGIKAGLGYGVLGYLLGLGGILIKAMLNRCF